MSSKENNFKEQFKQALISTAKVISEDYKLDIKKLDKDLNNKKTDFFDITNLSNKNDFVRLRAETDSGALKKKFSNKEIFNKKKVLEKTNTHEQDMALRLMFEIAISDGSLDKKELELIKKRANKIFSKEVKVSSVIKKIIDETESSTSIYPTVTKINEEYSVNEKENLLELLWEVVAADELVSPYEEGLYFKIAELIKIKRAKANQIKQSY